MSFWLYLIKYTMPLTNFVTNLVYKKLRQLERLIWLVEDLS